MNEIKIANWWSLQIGNLIGAVRTRQRLSFILVPNNKNILKFIFNNNRLITFHFFTHKFRPWRRRVTTVYVFTLFDSKIFKNTSSHFHISCISIHCSVTWIINWSIKLIFFSYIRDYFNTSVIIFIHPWLFQTIYADQKIVFTVKLLVLIKISER